MGGGDLVGESEDEAPVIVAFLSGRLALKQRYRVTQLRKSLNPQ